MYWFKSLITLFSFLIEKKLINQRQILSFFKTFLILYFFEDKRMCYVRSLNMHIKIISTFSHYAYKKYTCKPYAFGSLRGR